MADIKLNDIRIWGTYVRESSLQRQLISRQPPLSPLCWGQKENEVLQPLRHPSQTGSLRSQHLDLQMYLKYSKLRVPGSRKMTHIRNQSGKNRLLRIPAFLPQFLYDGK